MEKAEAINNLKKVLGFSPTYDEAFYTLFPEPKESEDERIRKELIEFIKWSVDRHFMREDFHQAKRPSEWLAYLEKQKEQKPSTPKYRVGDVMRTKQESAEGITDGLPVIVSVDDNYYYCTNEKIPISEQEEYEFPPMNMRQKPANEQFPPLEGLDAIKAKYYDDGFKNGFDEGVESVKPAEWSEEDERNRDRALFYVRNYQKNNGDTDGSKECADWLKSLPLNLKKKSEDVAKLCSSEWSEEDERKLQKCIKIVERWEEDYDIAYAPYSNMLKSIRPQPKQKWSEEDEKDFWGLTAYIPEEELKRLGITRLDILKKLKSIRPICKSNKRQTGEDGKTKLL